MFHNEQRNEDLDKNDSPLIIFHQCGLCVELQQINSINVWNEVLVTNVKGYEN